MRPMDFDRKMMVNALEQSMVKSAKLTVCFANLAELALAFARAVVLDESIGTSHSAHLVPGAPS